MQTKKIAVSDLRKGMVLYTRENNTTADVKEVFRTRESDEVIVTLVERDAPWMGSEIDNDYKLNDEVEIAIQSGWIVRLVEKSSKIEKYIETEYKDGLRYVGSKYQWAAKRWEMHDAALACVARHRLYDECDFYIEFVQ